MNFSMPVSLVMKRLLEQVDDNADSSRYFSQRCRIYSWRTTNSSFALRYRFACSTLMDISFRDGSPVRLTLRFGKSVIAPLRKRGKGRRLICVFVMFLTTDTFSAAFVRTLRNTLLLLVSKRLDGDLKSSWNASIVFISSFIANGGIVLPSFTPAVHV